MVTIYEFSRQPRFWIVHDDDGYWLVPGRANGWEDREPFVGHVTGLHELADPGEIDPAVGLPRGEDRPG